jgi:hypothetical protein
MVFIHIFKFFAKTLVQRFVRFTNAIVCQCSAIHGLTVFFRHPDLLFAFLLASASKFAPEESQSGSWSTLGTLPEYSIFAVSYVDLSTNQLKTNFKLQI